MSIELGLDQCTNCGIRDVGVHNPNCWIQILKDSSQSLMFSNAEGLVRINYPLDQKALEVISIESAYDGVGNCLFPRLRRIELQVGVER
jgi:hypothetical protein